jgi:hypothetical protein
MRAMCVAQAMASHARGSAFGMASSDRRVAQARSASMTASCRTGFSVIAAYVALSAALTATTCWHSQASTFRARNDGFRDAIQSAVWRYVVKLSDDKRGRLNTLIHAGKHSARLLAMARGGGILNEASVPTRSKPGITPS